MTKTKEEILKKIKEKLGKKIKNLYDKSYKRVYIDIDPGDIAYVANIVFNDLGARFNTASGVDTPDGIEILYHFTFDKACVTISFRTYLGKDTLEIESLTPMMKGAEWIEREIHELFGVNFKNHPNLKRLLLPDDWPEGLYPLRRDYKEEDYEARMKEEEKKS